MTAISVDEELDDEPDAPAKQFLRWTGSKRALVSELLKLVPADFGTYHEPFLGSGALFFALQPKRGAVLSDLNTRLTRTFVAIKSDLDAVLTPLRVYAEMYAVHGPAFYMHARDAVNVDEMTSPELAAWFVFMNKTGFNGIYRVNASGKYNVPSGKFARPPTICDEPVLRACSAALLHATVINSDFREVERRAVMGDFVYLDSPYIPVSKSADFTAYTAAGFGPAEQTALRDLALRLKHRGVHVLLSNSDTPITRELYQGFEIRSITRSGGMNSNVTKRGRVGELLIR